MLNAALFLFALFLVGTVIFTIVDHFRFKALAHKRAGLSICQFARSFDYRRVDTKIIRAAYEGLQPWAGIGVENFPVMATDDLDKLYGMVNEDLDDFAEDLAKKAGRTLQGLEGNPFYGRVSTVKDLVLLLNQQPKSIS